MNVPRQRAQAAAIEPGSVYRLVCSSRMVETAVVIDRFDDYGGIPHVRYQLRLETPNGQSISEDTRVLALSAFSERYKTSSQHQSAAKVSAA